jgi:hypothetical protein
MRVDIWLALGATIPKGVWWELSEKKQKEKSRQQRA